MRLDFWKNYLTFKTKDYPNNFFFEKSHEYPFSEDEYLTPLGIGYDDGLNEYTFIFHRCNPKETESSCIHQSHSGMLERTKNELLRFKIGRVNRQRMVIDVIE